MKSIEHYIDLADNASDLIQCVNPMGKFIYVNNAWKSTLGYSDKEIDNLFLWDIIHPDSMKHCKQTFEKVIEGKAVGFVEACFVTKDKKRIYVEGNVNCRYDKKGNVIATRGLFRNVSKQRKLQNKIALNLKELEKYNNLQQVLLDISASFVNIHNSDFNKQINKSLKILGKGLKADRIFIFELDFDKRITKNIYEWSDEGIEPQIDNLQNVPFEILKDWLDKHIKGETYYVNDVSKLNKDDLLYDFLNSQGIKSTLSAPMIKDGKCFGFIGMDKVKYKINYTVEQNNYLKQIGNMFSNVLQRMRVEKELQQSENRYKSLIENLNEIVYVLDMEGDIAYVSPNIEALSGYRVEDLIGRNFVDLVHPDDIKNRKKEFENVLHGVGNPTEYRFLTKDKRVVWIRTNAKTAFKDGKVIGVQGVFTDITDIKNIQRNLRDNTRFLNTVLESIQQGVMVINQDNTIEYMNPTLKKWNKEIDINIHKCYEVAKNKDKPCKNCIKDKCLKEGSPQTSQNIYNTDEGEKIVEIHCYPFKDIEGKANKVVEFIIDITDKKKMEKKLIESEEQSKRLISQMQQGHMVAEIEYNPDKTIKEYKIISINKSFEKILEMEGHELIGRGLLDIFPKDEKKWVNRVGEVAITTKPMQIEDYSNTMNKWFKVSAYSPKNGQVAVIVDDVTEKKALESSLFHEKEQFRRTLLSVGDGVITVDKNNLITLINKSAEKLTGWKGKDAIGKNFEEVFKVVDEKSGKKSPNIFENVLKNGIVVERDANNILMAKDGEIRAIEENAAPIKNKLGDITGAILVFKDFTDKKERQDKILYLSYHDQLTGLYNRRYFEEFISKTNDPNNLPLTVVMLDVNGLKLVNDAFGHLVGDELLKRVASILNKHTRPLDMIARIGGDEFIIVMPQTDKEHVINNLKAVMDNVSDEKIEGMYLSVSYGWETKTNTDTDFMSIYKKAEDHMYRRKLSESQSTRHSAVNVILKTLYEKSQREQLHSQRVSGFCVSLAKALGLTKEEIKEIRTAGLMHDIGKIIVPDDVLNKKEKLSENDWITIRRHPETGYKILSSVNEFASLAKEVLQHHEKWDGTGYPEGLKGEEIEYKARIIAVADAYDAMTTDRPYRKALSKAEAIEEIKKNAGTQFDPKIAKVFVDLISK